VSVETETPKSPAELDPQRGAASRLTEIVILLHHEIESRK
jgi:hypothetical protein